MGGSHVTATCAPSSAGLRVEDVTSTRFSGGGKLSGLVRLWFVVDAVVALAPPLYWAADGRITPILGVPAALFYFLAVDLCITASIIVAYFDERLNEEEPS